MLLRIGPVVAALGLIAACVAGSAHADEPPRPGLVAADSDAMLAVRAQAALVAAPELAGLNLTVDVMNRVAVVGGPVPDLAVLPKVRAVLDGVPGLAGHKVSGWVPTPVYKRPDAAPRPAEPPKPALAPGVDAAGLPPLVLAPPPPARPRPVPPLRLAPPDAAPDVVRPVTVTARHGDGGAKPAPAWDLGEPVAPKRPPAPPAAPKPDGRLPVTQAAHVAAAPAADVLAKQLAAAQAKEPRFSKLTVAHAAGAVTVGGRAATDDDVWDLVDAVKALPGVTRVSVRAAGGGMKR